jgi:hypothetical protein
VFDEVGRGNLGDSDDWADEELFTGKALGIAYERFGQTQEHGEQEGGNENERGGDTVN